MAPYVLGSESPKASRSHGLNPGPESSQDRVLPPQVRRATNAEFLDFLKLVARTYPRRQLHVVCDNYATHKHPNVQAWLAKHRWVQLHFTPTSGSWLNMVEIFFGIITKQAIRRGTFDSVRDLKRAIRTYIDGWNDRCQPFIWTKDANTILARAKRPTTSLPQH